MGHFQQAITYLKQAAEIYGHTLPPMHPHVVGIKRNIQRVSSQIR